MIQLHFIIIFDAGFKIRQFSNLYWLYYTFFQENVLIHHRIKFVHFLIHNKFKCFSQISIKTKYPLENAVKTGELKQFSGHELEEILTVSYKKAASQILLDILKNKKRYSNVRNL